MHEAVAAIGRDALNVRLDLCAMQNQALRLLEEAGRMRGQKPARVARVGGVRRNPSNWHEDAETPRLHKTL